MGEVTFLMQGVSCPSPLSCEESLERSPERRLSLGWSRGPPLAPCRLIFTSSPSSRAPRGWPLPGKANTQSDTHVSIRLLREGWPDLRNVRNSASAYNKLGWTLGSKRDAECRKCDDSKAQFYTTSLKNKETAAQVHFQHSLISQQATVLTRVITEDSFPFHSRVVLVRKSHWGLIWTKSLQVIFNILKIQYFI